MPSCCLRLVCTTETHDADLSVCQEVSKATLTRSWLSILVGEAAVQDTRHLSISHLSAISVGQTL